MAASAPPGQDSLFVLTRSIDPPAPLPSPAVGPRFDTHLTRPAAGQDDSEHLRLISADDVVFWGLTDAGLRALCEAVTAAGHMYTRNHPHLRALAHCNEQVRLPKPGPTLRFQLLNLLCHHDDLGFTRRDLAAIVKAGRRHGLPPAGDVIQAVNKTPQIGIANGHIRVGGVQYYRMPQPFAAVASRQQVKEAISVDGEPTELDLERAVAAVKERIHAEVCELPVHEWQWGHFRPGDTQVFAQPGPSNRAFRDRYVFDELGRARIPTAEHLADIAEGIYTREEIQVAIDGLTALLSKAPR